MDMLFDASPSARCVDEGLGDGWRGRRGQEGRKGGRKEKGGGLGGKVSESEGSGSLMSVSELSHTWREREGGRGGEGILADTHALKRSLDAMEMAVDEVHGNLRGKVRDRRRQGGGRHSIGGGGEGNEVRAGEEQINRKARGAWDCRDDVTSLRDEMTPIRDDVTPLMCAASLGYSQAVVRMFDMFLSVMMYVIQTFAM